MNKSLIEKIDAYIFRVFGLGLGLAGLAGLLLNNPAETLFTNVYGVIFLLIFASITVYAIVSIVNEMTGGNDGGQNE